MTRLLAVWCMVGSAAGIATAQPADPPRPSIAKATSLSGSVSARRPGASAFEVLATNTDLFTKDLLVLLPGATLTTNSKTVSLTSFADYDGQSPLPILETAIILDEAKDCDLAFTLDRGRIDITNTRAEGSAVVRVKFWDQTWSITLDAPGTRVALELMARWPAGTRFRPIDPTKPGPHPAPVASLVVLVLKGSPTVSNGEFALGLRSPPGLAMMEWDSVAGTRPEPKRLESIPAWADPMASPSPQSKKAAEVVEKFRIARASDPEAAIRDFLASSDPVEQRIALVTLGALDDLNALDLELREAKTIEEWDFGITVIRHWLGRAPGQDQKLYQALLARNYDGPSARIVMQLLFGFSREDLAQPETYDVLIEYLRHDRAAIRNLAAWHLVRLIPQGKTIPYKPNGTKDEAVAAYDAWRKLVPTGQLPPKVDDKK